MEFFKPLVSFVAAAGITVSSWFGLVPESKVITLQNQIDQIQNSITLGAYSPTGGATYRLKSSAASTDTTINLSSFKEPVSETPYTMTYLNTVIGYGTLEPQTPDQSEFISFTGITQNSDGSARLTGVTRGLTRSPKAVECTASTTLQVRHPAQSKFIFTSDSPCHFFEYAAKKNDETITGSWSIPLVPTIPANPASKAYVDGTAFSGIGNASETATGTVEIATSVEAAASTQTGALGRLALPASLATSTYNSATAANVLPVTGSDGKLDPLFIDRLATTTFSGKLSFSNTYATSTFASTTIRVFAATTTIHSATSTYSIPANLKYIIVEMVGGGGGGGGSTDTFRASGGGGASAYCKKIYMASELGTSSKIVVAGSGGAGGATFDGTAGRASNFNGVATSTGGAGGGGNVAAGVGGAGGTATGCDFTIPGQLGGNGFTTGATAVLSGGGGNTMFGGGGQGLYSNVESGGFAATGYGAGGGGSGSGSGTNDVAGGGGAPGLIIITEVTN